MGRVTSDGIGGGGKTVRHPYALVRQSTVHVSERSRHMMVPVSGFVPKVYLHFFDGRVYTYLIP